MYTVSLLYTADAELTTNTSLSHRDDDLLLLLFHYGMRTKRSGPV